MNSFIGLTLATLAGLASRDVAQGTTAVPLAGTWTLIAADKRLPDGAQVRGYGAAPRGRLIVDEQGRYSLQIFKAERRRFAADDKAAGSADLTSLTCTWNRVEAWWRARVLPYTASVQSSGAGTRPGCSPMAAWPIIRVLHCTGRSILV